MTKFMKYSQELRGTLEEEETEAYTGFGRGVGRSRTDSESAKICLTGRRAFS
jgi:hypothetical protein